MELLAGPLVWGALKLTRSLVTAGWDQLTNNSGVEEDDSDTTSWEWGGDIVLQARKRSFQSQQQHRTTDVAPFFQGLADHLDEDSLHPFEQTRRGLATMHDLHSGLQAIGLAAGEVRRVRSQVIGAHTDVIGVRSEVGRVHSQVLEVRSEIAGVRHDLASVHKTLDEGRDESKEYFARFTESLEATQRGIDIMLTSPLKQAKVSLKLFIASGDDLSYLKEASDSARLAVIQGHTLDEKLNAATIAIAAGYIYQSATKSPSKAKRFTVKGTLEYIIDILAPVWADPAHAATPDGRKTLTFLMDVVSCVSVLPPENVRVLPELDKRLLPAFAVLCASEPRLCQSYPEVGNTAMKAMLNSKTLLDLCLLTREVDVDISSCTSKEEVIQALLTSGKPLKPAGPPLPGKGATAMGDAASDRAALMALYNATGGPSWKRNAGWGTCAPLRDWQGVSVDGGSHGGDRVTKLDLHDNNLAGSIPPEIGELFALGYLSLWKNELSGSIPPALGGLAALQELWLNKNDLSGSIPLELGRSTKLRILRLNENKLSGPIPSVLGGLTALEDMNLSCNKLSGSIPLELGRLTKLRILRLNENILSGPIPSVLGGLTALVEMCLNINKLSGSIPPALGGLAALQELWLNKNDLSGSIPLELGRLTKLRILRLFENKLSGPIPSVLGGLTALEDMNLSCNKLSGSIPAELGQLSALQHADFRWNWLSGTKSEAVHVLPADCTVWW